MYTVEIEKRGKTTVTRAKSLLELANLISEAGVSQTIHVDYQARTELMRTKTPAGTSVLITHDSRRTMPDPRDLEGQGIVITRTL